MTRYPSTRRADIRERLHGIEVSDPYRWLEDGAAPEVQAWIAAQAELTRVHFDRLPIRDRIAARLEELLYVGSLGLPIRRGDRVFWSRRDPGDDGDSLMWRDGDGPARCLGAQDDGVQRGLIGVWRPSPDGHSLAYTTHANNADAATLNVIDVETGTASSVDVIDGASHADPAWTPRGDGFYYVWQPPANHGLAEVRFHRLGEAPDRDATVWGPAHDPSARVSVGLSREGRWVFVLVHRGWAACDAWFRERESDTGFHRLAEGLAATFYPIAWNDRFFVHTTDQAPCGQVLVVDPAKPAREHWTELVPERATATLQRMTLLGDCLALTYASDCHHQLELYDLATNTQRKVALPGIGSTLGPVGDGDSAFFSFSSFTTPTEIHTLDAATGETQLVERLESTIDSSQYLVERRFCTSCDGTEVPMFIVRRRDLILDGSAPAMLTAYGGFHHALLPQFDPIIFPWLERGGVHVVVNVRGGGELGEEWHQLGRGSRKQNAFDDFIAAAELVIREGYTRPARLAIRGASNGGLLVGAVITQRPELFRVAVCGLPLLDMVRYHLFAAGRTWIPEYGSPDDAEDFRALIGYSPYHRITPSTAYPSVLVVSAEHDDRVDPMHARKFVAALQATTTNGPVLLWIERSAGHMGAGTVAPTVAKLAEIYAFVLSELES